ncbi:MAG: glutathione S-transferase family protein [Stellaceae bacterium]
MSSGCSTDGADRTAQGEGDILTIWGRKTSSNVQKVLWVCTDLGIEYERLDWGGEFGGNDAPAYRTMNPNGLVPTVQDGELVIWESNTIMRYLCAVYGGAALHPADPARRSYVERWMDWQLSRLNAPLAGLMRGYYRTPEPQRDFPMLTRYRIEAVALWEMVEHQLAGQDYLAENTFTLADIGVGIWAHRWFHYPIERPEMPALTKWYQRLQQRPGFAAHVAGPIG